eukprot:6205793-Pleurochrysis_carterae.AAC.2
MPPGVEGMAVSAIRCVIPCMETPPCAAILGLVRGRHGCFEQKRHTPQSKAQADSGPSATAGDAGATCAHLRSVNTGIERGP